MKIDPKPGDAVRFLPPRPKTTPEEFWRSHGSKIGIVERFLSRGKRIGWVVIELAEHRITVEQRGRPKRFTVSPEDVLAVEIPDYENWRRARGIAPSNGLAPKTPRPPDPTAGPQPRGRFGLALEALRDEEEE